MAADAASAIGWIEVQPAQSGPGHVTIRGHAVALTDVAGKFTLQVNRASKGNKSDTSQGGVLNLKAGEAKALSTTTINVTPDDNLTLTLTLLSADGKEVFSTVLKSPQR